MNCNDAFDCMTDPASGRKHQLTAHLEQCPRCRQMREVLEPALELFGPASPQAREAVEGHSGLPFGKSGSSPLVTPETIRLAQNAASRLNRGARRDRDLLRRMVALSVRYTTALAIGALVAFCVVGVSENRGTSGVAAASCLWTDAREPDATLELRAPALVAACVACHVEESRSPGRPGGGPSATACLWQLAHGSRLATAADAKRSNPHGVVVSCVSCHLEKAKSDDNSGSALVFPRTEALPAALEAARIVAIDRMSTLPPWPAECTEWVNRAVAAANCEATFEAREMQDLAGAPMLPSGQMHS